jgi:DNA-binding ferritin-like protein
VNEDEHRDRYAGKQKVHDVKKGDGSHDFGQVHSAKSEHTDQVGASLGEAAESARKGAGGPLLQMAHYVRCWEEIVELHKEKVEESELKRKIGDFTNLTRPQRKRMQKNMKDLYRPSLIDRAERYRNRGPGLLESGWEAGKKGWEAGKKKVKDWRQH